MKRILFILLVVTASTTVMASISTSKVRMETRFLTDKMAYELNLNTPQYNDLYEINYDFVYSVRDIMDYVVRGEEWALNEYYESLDIRNDDLRWVLSDSQYRRFLGADYFYRPIYVTGGRWNFRIYVNYPNRNLFYFGMPRHYQTYCGAHYRPHFHHESFYRSRYNNFGHYSSSYRVRDQRKFHSYRRSDFGSVNFRPNTSVRPHNAPTRPGTTGRPAGSNYSRPEMGSRPSTSGRPSTSVRPTTRPTTSSRDKNVTPSRNESNSQRSTTTTKNRENSRESSSSRSSRPETVSKSSTERRSSTGSGSNRSSSRSTENRGSSSRR